jgi:hypothetical protein
VIAFRGRNRLVHTNFKALPGAIGNISNLKIQTLQSKRFENSENTIPFLGNAAAFARQPDELKVIKISLLLHSEMFARLSWRVETVETADDILCKNRVFATWCRRVEQS